MSVVCTQAHGLSPASAAATAGDEPRVSTRTRSGRRPRRVRDGSADSAGAATWRGVVSTAAPVGSPSGQLWYPVNMNKSGHT